AVRGIGLEGLHLHLGARQLLQLADDVVARARRAGRARDARADGHQPLRVLEGGAAVELLRGIGRAEGEREEQRDEPGADPHRAGRGAGGFRPAAPKYVIVNTKLPAATSAVKPSSHVWAAAASTRPNRTAYSARRSRKVLVHGSSVVSWKKSVSTRTRSRDRK